MTSVYPITEVSDVLNDSSGAIGKSCSEGLRLTRRGLLLLPGLCGVLSSRLYGAGFPTSRADFATLIPQPAAGTTAAVNPPGFGWLRADGASSYRLSVRDRSGALAYSAETPDPVHLPNQLLAPGDYEWDVEALDPSGQAFAARGKWAFTMPEGAPEFLLDHPSSILARVPFTHPRAIFLRDALPDIRRTLATTRKAAWDPVYANAIRYLNSGVPNPPEYQNEPDPIKRAGAFKKYTNYIRDFVDVRMLNLTLAYLLSGEERFGLAAKKIILEIQTWGPDGPMSLEAADGVEPGKAIAQHGPRAYDWLWDMLDSSERHRLRTLVAAYSRQMLKVLQDYDTLARPGESHNTRYLFLLCEHSVVLAGEEPDAETWLDYSLRALTTIFPHWGDASGGWAEGPDYGLYHNNNLQTVLLTLQRATGLDLNLRPSIRNVREFFLHCTSPIGEVSPFGDGAEGPIGTGSDGWTHHVLMNHYGRAMDDRRCIWYSQFGPKSIGDPVIALATEDAVEPEPPQPAGSAALFPGVGWVAMHSALDKPEEDTFILFKSSPYGSASHSHADQNTFAILKGGQALAMPSGYYVLWGSPHHTLWTRQTQANNGILVNGIGQSYGNFKATGTISGFRHGSRLTYACGDAVPAYNGLLTLARRRILFLRPGLIVVLDELESSKSREFSWLLHGMEEMRLDEAAGVVISTRLGASLTVKLDTEAGFVFSKTDQFDPPVNEGLAPEIQVERPNQWHFSARMKARSTTASIVSAMVVKGANETLPYEWLSHPGWRGVRTWSPEGEGSLWAQMTRNSAPPTGLPGGLVLAGNWTPAGGETEWLTVDAD